MIDHEVLAVARFSKDLARDHSQAEKVEDPTRFLAYVFLHAHGRDGHVLTVPVTQKHSENSDEGTRLCTSKTH